MSFFRKILLNKSFINRVVLLLGCLTLTFLVVLFLHNSNKLQKISLQNVIYPLKQFLPSKKSYFEDDFAIAAMFDNYSEKEVELFQTLSSIKNSCGEVCDTTIRGKPGKVRITLSSI